MKIIPHQVLSKQMALLQIGDLLKINFAFIIDRLLQKSMIKRIRNRTELSFIILLIAGNPAKCGRCDTNILFKQPYKMTLIGEATGIGNFGER